RRLMSQNTPAAVKPWGAVTEPAITWNGAFAINPSDQSHGFGKPLHDVKALNGLAAGAFDDIVLGAYDDQAVGARVEPPGDLHEVRPDDILGVGQRFALQQPDEWFRAVSLLVSGGNFISHGWAFGHG